MSERKDEAFVPGARHQMLRDCFASLTAAAASLLPHTGRVKAAVGDWRNRSGARWAGWWVGGGHINKTVATSSDKVAQILMIEVDNSWQSFCLF